MGTGPPHTQRSIRDERARRADGGEPLYTDSRSIQEYGGSLVIGLTAFGVKAHGVEKGERPTVEVHPDGVWIDLGGEPDE